LDVDWVLLLLFHQPENFEGFSRVS